MEFRGFMIFRGLGFIEFRDLAVWVREFRGLGFKVWGVAGFRGLVGWTRCLS